MEKIGLDRTYIDGIWRDVPMIAGMEIGSSPYADATYEVNVMQSRRAREPFSSMAMYFAEQGWNARAKARGLHCPMPTDPATPQTNL